MSGKLSTVAGNLNAEVIAAGAIPLTAFTRVSYWYWRAAVLWIDAGGKEV